MKKLLLLLLFPVTALAQAPSSGMTNVRVDANGNLLPSAVNGHQINLPAGTLVGGVAIGTGSGSGGDMFKADNLGGLANYPQARINLGLQIGVNVVGFNGAGGAPTSIDLTHGTALPITTGVSGLGTNVAAFLAVPSGANLATALTSALPFSKGGTGLTSLTGKSLQFLQVKSDETGFQFAPGGTGGVAGPVSSTDNAIVRFDSTTGAVIQNSGITIADGSTGAFSGSAWSGSAASLTTGHNLSGTGDAAFTISSFNGTADVSGSVLFPDILTTNNPGTVGSATQIPVITFNRKGQLTAVTGLTNTPSIDSVVGLGGGTAAFLKIPSSANFATMVTDETGTGAVVFRTSPTLVTPNLGVPTAIDISSATGSAAAASVGGLKSATTNVSTAAAVAPTPGQILTAVDSTHASWQDLAVGGNVSATTTWLEDNSLLKTDGSSRNIQETGITVDDSNNISGITSLSANTTTTDTFGVFDDTDQSGVLSFIYHPGVSSTNKSFTYTGPYNYEMILSGDTHVTFSSGSYTLGAGGSGTIATTSNMLKGDGAGNASSAGFTMPASYTTGQLLYASGSGAIGTINDTAVGRVLASGGTGSVPVYDNAPTIAGLTLNGGSLTFSGNQNASAWTTNGLRITGSGGTLTDTSSSGTVASAMTNRLSGNAIAASSATTFTRYYNTYIGEPTAGTNVTLTNKYAIGAESAAFGVGAASSTFDSSGIFTAKNGAVLGTPASVTLTNADGTAASLIAGTATVANTEMTGTGSVDTTSFPTFASSSSSSAQTMFTDSALTYNATNGNLGATTFTGAATGLTGTASININGTVGATTPGTGAFTTLSGSGAYTNTKSGAASVSAGTYSGVPFAGTGTTSFPLVYINDANATASTTLSTAGTYLGVNGHGTQDLMNLLKDGTSKFVVSSGGNVTVAGNVHSLAEVYASAGNAQMYGPSSGVIRLSNATGSGVTRINFTNDSNSFPGITNDLVNGFSLVSAAGTTTWNDPATANSGTVANRYLFGIAAPTLTSTGTSVTNTVASTVYIGGAPTDSTNTTSTTKYALNVGAGTSLFGGAIKSGGLAFASLPTAAVGMMSYLTDGATGNCGDSLCTTFGTTVTGGGGSLKLLVWYNGTNWTLIGK